MSDQAIVDIVMDGVDNGASAMFNKGAYELELYNQQLTKLAQNSAAEQATLKAKESFEKLTQAERDALIANKEYRNSMASMQEEANQMNSEFDRQNDTAGKLKMSMTELNSGIMLVQQGMQVAKQVYAETAGKALEYDEEISKLSRTSGQGAETTSRFVQVLDDFKISTDDIETAMKKMTSNGLVPNFDTIKKLAQEYQAIQDPLAKNEFLIKNLGKSSSEYTLLLSQNTDDLQKNFDTQNQGLIVNEAQIAKAEQLRRAQDDLNDSWQSITTTLGNDVIPEISVVTTALNENLTKGIQWDKALGSFVAPIAIAQRIGEWIDASKKLDGELSTNTAQVEKSKAPLTAQETAVVQLSNATKGYNSVMAQFTDEQLKGAMVHTRNGQNYIDEGRLIDQLSQKTSAAAANITKANVDISNASAEAFAAAQNNTQNSVASWGQASSDISQSIYQVLVPSIYDYNNALNNIPSTKTTTITNTIQPPPASGASGVNGAGVGASGQDGARQATATMQGQIGNTIIYIQEAHFDSQGNLV